MTVTSDIVHDFGLGLDFTASVAPATGLMAKGVAEVALLLVLLETGVIGRDVFSLLVLIMFGCILLTPPAIDAVHASGQAGGTSHRDGVGSSSPVSGPLCAG